MKCVRSFLSGAGSPTGGSGSSERMFTLAGFIQSMILHLANRFSCSLSPHIILQGGIC